MALDTDYYYDSDFDFEFYSDSSPQENLNYYSFTTGARGLPCGEYPYGPEYTTEEREC